MDHSWNDSITPRRSYESDRPGSLLKTTHPAESDYTNAELQWLEDPSTPLHNDQSAPSIARMASHKPRVDLTRYVPYTRALKTDDDLKNAERVIIVMGHTGVGKSRFVREATGQDVAVGNKLSSKTQRLKAHHFMHQNSSMALVDTPGFDDTHRPDTLVFRELAAWLAARYQEQSRLTAIVYIQRITDTRVSGSILRSLMVMKRMLGIESFPYLTLVTSMWDVCEEEVALTREAELKDQFWNDLLSSGAKTGRFRGDQRSALSILDLTVSDARVRLTIQRELVDQCLPLDRTSAGAYLQHEVHFGQDECRENSSLGVGRQEDLLAKWNINYGSLWLMPEEKRESLWGGNIYTPLKHDQIRLLKVLAGERDMPVEVVLVTTTLAEAPPFAAMSYVAGKGPGRAKIHLRDNQQVSHYTVASNVQQALSQLRLRHTDILFWIDALCINQEDVQERALQVRHMFAIYQQAENVCIWLGIADEEKRDAFGLARRVLELDSFEELLRSAKSVPEDAKAFDALTLLMESPWFSRRWCVQEIMVAKYATIHSGELVMSWKDFVDVVELLSSRWSEVQDLARSHNLFVIAEAELVGAVSLIRTSQEIFRRSSNGQILERLLSLETLLWRLATFEVSVMHDAIYAILELVSDTISNTKLRVDYTIEIPALFQQAVEFVVRSSGNLDIICRPWAPRCGLPSWITTTAKLPFHKSPKSRMHTRQYGDTLVGAPGTNIYSACGRRSARANTTFRREGSQFILSAKGIEIGKIEQISQDCVDGVIPKLWRELAGWTDTNEAVPDHFWRLLVADRKSTGARAPHWYRRACESVFRKSAGQNLSTKEHYASTESTNVREFLRRVQCVTWSRVLGLIKMNQQEPLASSLFKQSGLCLCPPETEVGDKICILFGCSVPVVLRQIEAYYIFIGECFAYGYMEGEIVPGVGQNCPSVVFDIV